jgi:universal stress protein E
VFGKSWVELIRQILKQQHDLVITGTRQRGAAVSVLFGSTGMKLLRKCPCPVWITKPREDRRMTSILVANDLSPVSELALNLGVSMADLHQAQLHVLHVLELGLGRREWDSYNIRERARAEASKKLEAQLARVDAGRLQKPPKIEIVVDAAHTAIIHQIEQCGIDLLVMGTVARGGVAGVFTGNTAERLLPRIRCSVLAVKPHDFVCPIAAE